MKNKLITTLSLTLLALSCPAVIADAVSWDKTSQEARSAVNEKNYDRAVELYKKALEDARGAGLEAKFVAVSLSDLASVYALQGKSAEAESTLKEALAVKEKAYGPEDENLVSTLSNLGQYYKNGNNYSQSLVYLKRAAAIETRTSGATSVKMIPLINAIAAVESATGDLEAATAHLREVVTLAKASKDRSAQIISLNNLAVLLRKQDKQAEAEPLLQEALALQSGPAGKDEIDRGIDSPHNKAAALTKLARVKREKGQFAEARPLLLQAYELLTAKDSKEPVAGQIIAMDNLAMCCKEMGDYADAVKYYRHSLKLQENHPGTTTEERAARYTNLALALVASGDTTESEGLLTNSLALMEEQYGKESDKIAPALNNLAEVYRIENNFGKAEPTLMRSYEIRRKTGASDPAFSDTTSDLGVLYRQMGREGDSTKYFEETVTLRESTPDTPELATALLNLAKSYRQSKQNDKAEALYKRALAIREKVFGPNDQQVAAVLRNYAILLRDMGRADEARALNQRAHKIEDIADM